MWGKWESTNIQRKNQFPLVTLPNEKRVRKDRVVETKSGPLVWLFDLFIIFNFRGRGISYSIP